MPRRGGEGRQRRARDGRRDVGGRRLSEEVTSVQSISVTPHETRGLRRGSSSQPAEVLARAAAKMAADSHGGIWPTKVFYGQPQAIWLRRCTSMVPGVHSSNDEQPRGGGDGSGEGGDGGTGGWWEVCYLSGGGGRTVVGIVEQGVRGSAPTKKVWGDLRGIGRRRGERGRRDERGERGGRGKRGERDDRGEAMAMSKRCVVQGRQVHGGVSVGEGTRAANRKQVQNPV
jgi:hypothetical protein